VTEDPERRPLTEEQRQLAGQVEEWAVQQIREAQKRPRPPATSRGKFTEPLGLDEHGNLQPPLTPDEEAHNEEVRRRALRGEPNEADTP
jgi:hypothetical protein